MQLKCRARLTLGVLCCAAANSCGFHSHTSIANGRRGVGGCVRDFDGEHPIQAAPGGGRRVGLKCLAVPGAGGFPEHVGGAVARIKPRVLHVGGFHQALVEREGFPTR